MQNCSLPYGGLHYQMSYPRNSSPAVRVFAAFSLLAFFFALRVPIALAQFESGAFNVFNHTNFAPPSTLTFNSSGFGVFTATFPARQLQLALKLVF